VGGGKASSRKWVGPGREMDNGLGGTYGGRAGESRRDAMCDADCGERVVRGAGEREGECRDCWSDPDLCML